MSDEPDPIDWDEASLGKYTDDQLEEMAQGCTEFSCIYHGIVNRERHRRARKRREGEMP